MDSWRGLGTTSPATRCGRTRSDTQIFRDVINGSRRLFVPVHRGEELPPAVAMLVVAACVAEKLVAATKLLPPVHELMACDHDSHLLVQQHERQVRSSRSFRDKVEEAVYKNNRDQLADMAQAVLALASSVLYVYETYTVARSRHVETCSSLGLPNSLNSSAAELRLCTISEESSAGDDHFFLRVTETCFAVIFAIDYLVRFYIAPNYLRYFFSLFPMVDLVTIIPVIASWVEDGAATFGFIRVVRLLRLLRVLKAYRLVGGGRGKRSDWSAVKQANMLVFTVFSLLFVSAGFIQLVERDQGLTFAEAIYFVVVTMSTVGYGDIAPTTALGRFVMIVFILLSVVIIPVQTRGLIDLLGEQPKELFSHLPRGKEGYVLLCGHHLTHDEIFMFVREFFHPVHSQPPSVVVVSREKMTAELRLLLDSHLYKRRMRYVLGSILDNEVLRKVQAEKAKACFILATGKQLRRTDNKHSQAETLRFTSQADLDVVDTAVALQALNFRCFTEYKVETYTLLNHSHGKSVASTAAADHIVCLDDSRLKLMAQSCMCPGLSTLVINFMTSYSSSTERKGRRVTEPVSTQCENECQRGMTHEVFEMRVPEQLVGMNFIEAAVVVYMKFEITLLGVMNFRTSPTPRIAPLSPLSPATPFSPSSTYRATGSTLPRSVKGSDTVNFVLNPGHRHTLRTGDRLAVLALDLATCETCQGYTDFPVGDTAFRRRHSRREGLANPCSIRVVRTTIADVGSRKKYEVRKRLKRTIWAVVALQKLRPLRSTLEERTVLDVNVPEIRNRTTEDHFPARERTFSCSSAAVDSDLSARIAELKGKLQELEAEVECLGRGTASARETALRKEIASLQAATQKVSQRDWRREGIFDDHIVVAGGQKNLAAFIRALKRSLCATRTPLKTVIFLAEQPPVKEVWERVSHYRFFYYCQGNPKLPNDLYRAGLERASSLVVLAQDVLEDDEEDDADAVFITMAAMNLCPMNHTAMQAYMEDSPHGKDSLGEKISQATLKRKGMPQCTRTSGKPLFIIAELVKGSSVKYFNDFDISQAAKTFDLTLEEKQELRKRARWKQWTAEYFEDLEEFITPHQYSPFFSAGYLISNEMLGPLLPHSYYSPSIISIVEQFMQGSLNQFGSFLGHVHVPDTLVGKTYGELFYDMSLKREMVPLGLYRAPGVENQSPLPYVVTSPPKDTVVFSDDMVYVLQSGHDVEEEEVASTTSDTSEAQPFDTGSVEIEMQPMVRQFCETD